MKAVILLSHLLSVATCVHGQTPADLNALRPIGTMGKGEAALKDGKEAVLFEHEGRGCFNHFRFGGNFNGVENDTVTLGDLPMVN